MADSVAGSVARIRSDCPKLMAYGPCGGVQADGGCEVDSRRCVFVDGDVVEFAGSRQATELRPPAAVMAALIASRPVIVADFPGRALDVGSILACADILRGAVDVVLTGDAPSSRLHYAPSLRAQLIQDRGLPVWAGLNCRDRNRVALESEVISLAAVGVSAVHCVTGDHPVGGHRPDAAAVFDLDSTRLAALAAGYGHLVSVAESPAAPPTELRPLRMLAKQDAGAAVCFVNHCGPASVVRVFLQRFWQAGGTAAPVACVPVVVDRGSTELLRSFPGLVLPDGFLNRILQAADPRRSGEDAAVELASDMLAIDGMGGVNLSGGPAPGEETAFAESLARIGARLRQ